MPAKPTTREALRIGGGYDAPEQGASPAGGLDIDPAGNLATNGDVTVKGQLFAGATPTAITNADGQLDGARIQPATVAPSKLDSAAVYSMGRLTLTAAGASVAKIEYTGGGTLRLNNNGGNFVDLDVNMPNGSDAQTARIFRNSNASAGDTYLIVYSPGSSAQAFHINAKAGDVWISNNCSADSFTDRSPIYRGARALEILRAIRPAQSQPPREGQGDQSEFDQVDHESLGPIAVQRQVRDQETGQARTERGRDLGKQIVVNSAAILELLERIETLEQRVGVA